MSGPTFREAMINVSGEAWDNPHTEWPDVTAAILAMPEMQAIKAHLRRDAEQVAEDDWKRNAEDVLSDWNLPPSVVAWVMA